MTITSKQLKKLIYQYKVWNKFPFYLPKNVYWATKPVLEIIVVLLKRSYEYGKTPKDFGWKKLQHKKLDSKEVKKLIYHHKIWHGFAYRISKGCSIASPVLIKVSNCLNREYIYEYKFENEVWRWRWVKRNDTQDE